MPDSPLFDKSIFSSTKPSSSDAAKGVDSERRKRVRVWFIVLLAIIAGLVFLMNSWHRAMLAEEYLSDLQDQSASTDAAVLAVLGAKLAQSDSPLLRQQSTEVLGRAVDAGDNDPGLWQTVSWVYARNGDVSNALDVLQQGDTSLGGSDRTLDACASRLKAIGMGASPAAYANAVSPMGAQPLLDLYANGSFLSPLVEAWGRVFPNSSGFRTRQLWAESEPNNPQACRLWGLALLRDGRNQEALAALERCVAMTSNSADTHDALGQALEVCGRSSDAETEFLRTLEMDPRRASTLIEFGRAARDDSPNFAVAALDRATALAPKSADAWLALADTTQDMSVYDVQALHAYQEAGQLDPARLSLNDSYAIALINNQQMADAESLLRAILRAQPSNQAASVQLASVLFATPSPTRLSEAESLVLSVLQSTDRPQPQISTLAAQILLAGGKPQEAVEALHATISVEPHSAAAWRLLAQAYAATGNRGAAKAAATSAAESQRILNTLAREKGLIAQQEYSVPFHQRLEALYSQIGDQRSAHSEQEIVEQLQTDTVGFRNRRERTQSMLRSVFGPIAEDAS